VRVETTPVVNFRSKASIKEPVPNSEPIASDFDEFGFETAPVNNIIDMSSRIADVFKIGETIPSNVKAINPIMRGPDPFAMKIFDFNKKSARFEIVDSVLKNNQTEYDRVRLRDQEAAFRMAMACGGNDGHGGMQNTNTLGSSGEMSLGSNVSSILRKKEHAHKAGEGEHCSNCGSDKVDGICSKCAA
jgi:hypothetical protein